MTYRPLSIPQPTSRQKWHVERIAAELHRSNVLYTAVAPDKLNRNPGPATVRVVLRATRRTSCVIELFAPGGRGGAHDAADQRSLYRWREG